MKIPIGAALLVLGIIATGIPVPLTAQTVVMPAPIGGFARQAGEWMVLGRVETNGAFMCALSRLTPEGPISLFTALTPAPISIHRSLFIPTTLQPNTSATARLLLPGNIISEPVFVQVGQGILSVALSEELLRAIAPLVEAGANLTVRVTQTGAVPTDFEVPLAGVSAAAPVYAACISDMSGRPQPPTTGGMPDTSTSVSPSR